jgi:hypothetical protein
MKKQIDNSAGMKTFVELRPLENPQNPGWKYLKLTTTWDDARNPNEEQTKFDICLTPEAFAALKDLINEM